MYEDILSIFTLMMNAISVVIIIFGVVSSALRLFMIEFRRFNSTIKAIKRQSIRAYLGSYILLGLEFLIAADIIATIAHPSVEELINLSAIVIIRTFISYFLGKEIEHAIQLEKKEST